MFTERVDQVGDRGTRLLIDVGMHKEEESNRQG